MTIPSSDLGKPLFFAPMPSGEAPQSRLAAAIKVESRSASPMTQLPRDVLEEILARLPPADMLVASGVCRAWRTATGETSLLIRQLQKIRRPDPAGLAAAQQAAIQRQNPPHNFQENYPGWPQSMGILKVFIGLEMLRCLSVELNLWRSIRDVSSDLLDDNRYFRLSRLGAAVGFTLCYSYWVRTQAHRIVGINLGINAAIQVDLTQVAKRLGTPVDAAPRQLRQALVTGVHCMRAALAELLPAIDVFATDPDGQESSHRLCQMAHLVLPLGEAERQLSPSQISTLLVAATDRQDLSLIDWLRPSMTGE